MSYEFNVKVGKVIEELSTYKVVVWEGTDAAKSGEYALINKETGVMETSTPLLLQALQFLDQLQAKLDAERDIKEDKETPTTPDNNVVPIH